MSWRRHAIASRLPSTRWLGRDGHRGRGKSRNTRREEGGERDEKEEGKEGREKRDEGGRTIGSFFLMLY